jgi:predicted Fe-Mo cluster-binding NifX family protein
MILAMPVLEDRGRESRISMHFGHNPLFAICDTEKKSIRIVSVGEQDAVFTLNIGGKAMAMLRQKGIEVKTGDFATVREVLDNADRLTELDEGCGHG